MPFSLLVSLVFLALVKHSIVEKNVMPDTSFHPAPLASLQALQPYKSVELQGVKTILRQ